VYCQDKKTGVVWVREYVEPEITDHNHYIGSVSKNLGVFFKSVSVGYMQDLRDYADRYNLMTLGEAGRATAYALLYKMMYALKKEMPTIDLMTITPADVVADDLPVKTIRDAVESGLLPEVDRWEGLGNTIL